MHNFLSKIISHIISLNNPFKFHFKPQFVYNGKQSFATSVAAALFLEKECDEFQMDIILEPKHVDTILVEGNSLYGMVIASISGYASIGFIDSTKLFTTGFMRMSDLIYMHMRSTPLFDDKFGIAKESDTYRGIIQSIKNAHSETEMNLSMAMHLAEVKQKSAVLTVGNYSVMVAFKRIGIWKKVFLFDQHGHGKGAAFFAKFDSVEEFIEKFVNVKFKKNARYEMSLVIINSIFR